MGLQYAVIAGLIQFAFQLVQIPDFAIGTIAEPPSCFIIFTNPSIQVGYDTRAIFKQSLTGLNSEFSFS